MVLESWPELRALRKTEGEPWKEFAPAFRVVRPYRSRKRAAPSPQLELNLGAIPVAYPDTAAARRRRAFDQFRFSLPKPVAARAEKFGNRQWPMLRLFRAQERALELAALNPALCFALGNYRSFADATGLATREDALDVAGKRQRDIAGWLGFPATDAAARILAKLAPESASVELLRPLRAALREPGTIKALAHLPRLNAGVTAIVVDRELAEASTAALLTEIAECPLEKYRAHAAEMLGGTLAMLRTVHPDRGTPKVQSMARLRAIHEEISKDFLKQMGPGLKGDRLPRPPLAGTAQILPIRTVAELVEEGREQSNCVATYAECVQRRDLFIYRVLKPERATLSICRNPAGDWEIDELKGRGNQAVSEQTWRLVERWLERYSLSA